MICCIAEDLVLQNCMGNHNSVLYNAQIVIKQQQQQKPVWYWTVTLDQIGNCFWIEVATWKFETVLGKTSRVNPQVKAFQASWHSSFWPSRVYFFIAGIKWSDEFYEGPHKDSFFFYSLRVVLTQSTFCSNHNPLAVLYLQKKTGLAALSSWLNLLLGMSSLRARAQVWVVLFKFVLGGGVFKRAYNVLKSIPGGLQPNHMTRINKNGGINSGRGNTQHESVFSYLTGYW